MSKGNNTGSLSKSSIFLLDVKGSTYHEFDDVDTEMFVNHGAQAYAGPGKPIKHGLIGSIDNEFHIGLHHKVLG
jgi:hypothetical protein